MTRVCPICGQDAFQMIWRHKSVENGCCASCGHVYAISDTPVCYETFGQSYDERQLQDPGHPMFKLARHRMNRIAELSACANKSMMEVGCGYGHFLKQMQDAGAEVMGYEPGSKGAEFAKTRFALTNVIQGAFDPAVGRDEERFDVIASFHMLEHTERPVEYIQSWARMLKAGGLIMIAVPNLYSLHRDLHELYFIARGWHRQIFSPQILRRLLEDAGLRVMLVEDEPETRMSPSSVLMIAEKKPGVSLSDYPVPTKETCDIVSGFHADLALLCQAISDWVTTNTEQGKTIAVFGAGLHTEALFELCAFENTRVSYLLDDDQAKWDKMVCGIEVIGLDDGRFSEIDCVLVSSLAAEEQILARLGADYSSVEAVGIYHDLAEAAGLNSDG